MDRKKASQLDPQWGSGIIPTVGKSYRNYRAQGGKEARKKNGNRRGTKRKEEEKSRQRVSEQQTLRGREQRPES